jgi:hypothetical protein
MLHPFDFIPDLFVLLGLEQSQMQVSSDIDLKGESVIRINPQQLRWPGAEALTRFG